MSIDHLTKTQVVLLTFLVSFVTAITTSIATVSLSDTSSDSVGQTIVRVVEKTIEKVTDLGTSTIKVDSSKPQIKYATNTIVRVNETDFALLNTLAEARKSVVRIYGINDTNGTTSRIFISLGIIRSKEGSVYSFFGALPSNVNGYKATNSNGDEYDLNLTKAPDQQGIAIFNLLDKAGNAQIYPAIKTEESIKTNSGDRVVVLSGQKENISSIVYIKSLMAVGSETWATTTQKEIKKIQVEPVLDEKIKGAVLVSERGELIGVRSAEDPNIFIYLP